MRISRKKYIEYSLVLIILSFVFYYNLDNNSNLSFYYIYSLIVFFLNIYLTIGRLHDINLSAWYSVILFIPIINLSFLALYFIPGTKGENKFGVDPENRINPKKLVFNNNQKIKSIEKIEKKLEILDQTDLNVLNNNEIEFKKEKLLKEKENLIKQRNNLDNFEFSKKNLITLFNNNLIDKSEYNSKLSKLKEQFEIDNYDYIDLNSMFYYLSEGKEHGPISFEKIINLINNNKVNPNCYIRLINEKEYHKRVIEILKSFQIN